MCVKCSPNMAQKRVGLSCVTYEWIRSVNGSQMSLKFSKRTPRK